MTNLNNKTLFVSGASRGIGLAIAKRAAQDGANIILAAKIKTGFLTLAMVFFQILIIKK